VRAGPTRAPEFSALREVRALHCCSKIISQPSEADLFASDDDNDDDRNLLGRTEDSVNLSGNEGQAKEFVHLAKQINPRTFAF
jgi:hypothetical protein